MQIQVEGKVFRLRSRWDEEIIIELPGSDRPIVMRIRSFGQEGMTVLLPQCYTYAPALSRHCRIILNAPLLPAGIELDVGDGKLETLRRLEYLDDE